MNLLYKADDWLIDRAFQPMVDASLRRFGAGPGTLCRRTVELYAAATLAGLAWLDTVPTAVAVTLCSAVWAQLVYRMAIAREREGEKWALPIERVAYRWPRLLIAIVVFIPCFISYCLDPALSITAKVVKCTPLVCFAIVYYLLACRHWPRPKVRKTQEKTVGSLLPLPTRG